MAKGQGRKWWRRQGRKEARSRKTRSQRRRAAHRSRIAEPTKCQEITSESNTVAATDQSTAEGTNKSQRGSGDHANIPHWFPEIAFREVNSGAKKKKKNKNKGKGYTMSVINKPNTLILVLGFVQYAKAFAHHTP